MGIERYAGRVALVTGASSGIGAAITQALLRKGLTVVGMARRVDMVKALALKNVPGTLYPVQGDVSDENSILSTFKWIRENLSGIDVLVNNAGLGNDSDLTSGQTEEWKRILDVNVLGLSICTREAVQDMLRRGVDDGFIIHINSIVGHEPPSGSMVAMYAASKHAVKVLLEGLRKDLVARKSNIRVGEISPGAVKTEMMKNFKALPPNFYDLVPSMESEDIAEAAVYMLSQNPRVQVHDIVLYPTGGEF